MIRVLGTIIATYAKLEDHWMISAVVAAVLIVALYIGMIPFSQSMIPIYTNKMARGVLEIFIILFILGKIFAAKDGSY